MSDRPAAPEERDPMDLDAAYETLERAQIMLAPMIPGCAARRYEPPVRAGGSQILLCFAENGPIAPILTVSPMKYGTLGQAHFWYGLALWKDGLRQGFTFPYVMGYFSGPYLKGLVALGDGPEAIAEAIRAALDPYDIRAIIAAGTPERMLASRLPHSHVWQCFMLALCAIYSRRYDEAEALLRDYFAQSDDNERGWIWKDMFVEAKAYSKALKSNPEAVRDRLIAIMHGNWARLKVVAAPGSRHKSE
jgi:hypothetical protein